MSAAVGKEKKGVSWPSNNTKINNAGIAAAKGVPERPARLAEPVAKMTTESAAALGNTRRNNSTRKALNKAAAARAFVNSNTHDPANVKEEIEFKEMMERMEKFEANMAASAAAGAAAGAAAPFQAKPRGPGKRGSRRSRRSRRH
jgi:hypothetical protein